MGGHGSLKGLVVANPPGYKSEAAMKLGEVADDVPASLFADKVHIKSIAIIAPEIHLEGSSRTTTSAKSWRTCRPSAARWTPTSPTPRSEEFQLDSFVLRGARVSADLAVPGLQPMALTLRDLELSNLGQGPEGVRRR